MNVWKALVLSAAHPSVAGTHAIWHAVRALCERVNRAAKYHAALYSHSSILDDHSISFLYFLQVYPLHSRYHSRPDRHCFHSWLSYFLPVFFFPKLRSADPIHQFVYQVPHLTPREVVREHDRCVAPSARQTCRPFAP